MSSETDKNANVRLGEIVLTELFQVHHKGYGCKSVFRCLCGSCPIIIADFGHNMKRRDQICPSSFTGLQPFTV
jgi:hypothetical protein